MFETEKDFINELKPGMVFYFKDVEVSEYTPHYFVIINKDICNTPILVLPVSTSQVEKRIKYYEKCGFNKECLVIVEPTESNGILSKKSAFDCNQIKYKGILDLYELYIKGKADYEGILPEIVIEKLRTGVIISNQVENWIKDLI